MNVLCSKITRTHIKMKKTRASTALDGPETPRGGAAKMGDYTFRLCRTINHLGLSASGLAIYEFLEGENIDVNTAQMYGTLQRLLDQGVIERTGQAPSLSGPPLKLYAVTEKGAALLEEKRAALHELVGFDNRLSAYRKAEQDKEPKHDAKVKADDLQDHSGRPKR